MGKSFVDKENLELFQQYINGAMNKINSSIDKKVDEKFISFIEDNVSDGEILDARGTERTLGIRLNKLDDRINKSDNLISVLSYGAKGDGKTDDTNSIVKCFEYCCENNKTMYFPDGTYILNAQLKKSTHPVTDSNSDKPIRIIGESAYGVFIETTKDISPLCDFSRSKYVFVQNLYSKTSWFKIVQYGDDFRDFSKVRDVYINNVGSLNRENGYPSWNLFVNTPAPSNYNNEEVDSNYLRYALEIVNNSGYNPIMINNFPNENADGSPGYPSDQSAIGIIDEVENSSGVILIEGERRSFYQCKNSSSPCQSAVRDALVYEVDNSGHVAIGCSTQNSDNIAPGSSTLKIRDYYPSITLYDANKRNRKAIFGNRDDVTYLECYDENGEIVCSLNMNYKNKTIDFTGSVQIGKLLTWSGNNANKTLTGISSIYVPSNIVSRFENIEGGVEGQIVSIVSDGSLTVNHNREDWGNIRTSTSSDVTLEKGIVYTLTKINELWYLK